MCYRVEEDLAWEGEQIQVMSSVRPTSPTTSAAHDVSVTEWKDPGRCVLGRVCMLQGGGLGRKGEVTPRSAGPTTPSTSAQRKREWKKEKERKRHCE